MRCRRWALFLALLLALMPVTAAAANGFDEAALGAFRETLGTLKIKDTRHDGITRVVGDSVRGRYGGVQRVQITPNGKIWLMRGSAVDKLFRAARPGAWQRADGLANARELLVSPTGGLVVRTNKALLERDGKAWLASTKAPAAISELVLTDDGDAWAEMGNELAHYDGSAWTTFEVEDLGLDFTLPFEEIRQGALDGGVTGVTQASNGSIWVSAEDRNHRPAGLARFDGETWSEVQPFGLDERVAAIDVVAGADGVVWVWVIEETGDPRGYLARWDGDAWAGWEAPALWVEARDLFFGIEMTVLPDGRLWLRWSNRLRPAVLFDGETWAQLPTYTSQAGGTSVSGVPVPAPDGTFWLTSYGQGYPQSIYIYDLDEVVPVTTEPAVAFDPR